MARIPRRLREGARSGSITPPADLKDELSAIGREALRIHESAEFSAQTQFEQAKIWRTFNFGLGVPSAVLAVMGGSVILTSDSWQLGDVPGSAIGGLLALSSGALTAILTTINSSRRMTQAQSSANAYLQLQTESRQFVTIDISVLTRDEARAVLEGLTSTRNELNKTADAPSRRAYNRVKKNLISDGGQDYAIDEGH